MRRALKISLALFGGVVTVIVVALGAVIVMFWPHCDKDEKVLARDAQGRSIVSVFKACTSLGTSLDQTLQLVSPLGRRQTMMDFEPNGGMLGCKGRRLFSGTSTAHAVWLDPYHAQISIDEVAAINEMHKDLDGIQITYDIGVNISEVCPPETKKPSATTGPTVQGMGRVSQ